MQNVRYFFFIKKVTEITVASKMILSNSTLFNQINFNRHLQPFSVLDDCMPNPLDEQTVIDSVYNILLCHHEFYAIFISKTYRPLRGWMCLGGEHVV